MKNHISVRYVPGIYTDSHLFDQKLTKRCESLYISSNLYLSMEMYTDSHLLVKMCESLYISDPYLMDQECTRIHTFSNKVPKTTKNEKVWILVNFWPIRYGSGMYKDSHILWRFWGFWHFLISGNVQGFTLFQILFSSLFKVKKEKIEKVWILVHFQERGNLHGFTPFQTLLTGPPRQEYRWG